MAVSSRVGGARTHAWGRGIVATLSGLLIVNAVWLFFAVGTPAVVESDTGASLAELRAAFPTVADELAGRGHTIALLVGGLGAMALVVSVTGLRAGAAGAGASLWVFVAALLAVAVNALTGGRWDVGATYLVLALATAVGVVLATGEVEGDARPSIR